MVRSMLVAAAIAILLVAESPGVSAEEQASPLNVCTLGIVNVCALGIVTGQKMIIPLVIHSAEAEGPSLAGIRAGLLWLDGDTPAVRAPP